MRLRTWEAEKRYPEPMRSSVSALALLLALVLHPVVGLACVPEEGKGMPCCDEPTDGCHSDSEASGCCTDAAPSAPEAAVPTPVALGLAGGRDAAGLPPPGPL